MSKFLVTRFLSLIPVLLGISIFVFMLIHMTPGDPALLMLGEHAPEEQLENLREEMGLNQPLPIQYFNWLQRAITFNFGRSLRSNKLVTTEIMERLPATGELALAAMILSIIIGIPVGIISATKPNSVLDNVFMVGTLVAVGMPVFWQGLMFIIIFSVGLGWLPSSGRMEGIEYLILPAIALSTVSTATLARITRSAMLEVISQDYIQTARSKGLAERTVIYKHALRNALIPVVTIVGLQFGRLMGGAVITETIFAWPGVGRMIVDAIRTKDFPLVQGGIMLFAIIYALVNLIVDIMYTYLDPKLRTIYQ